MNKNNVLALILGGGKGTRLYPLTMRRAKPAVPFGGKFRLVDIPISNCINSGFRNIYVLTQFNSASLHVHISDTYRFDSFNGGFVEILAAEQTFEHDGWYEGTADAVRKNFEHFNTQNPKYYIVLSGDQLYRMDLALFLKRHIDAGADLTIAATPVTRENATGLGILKADKDSRVSEFFEKPDPNSDISTMKMPKSLYPDKEAEAAGRDYLASMGIYIFNASKMQDALDNDFTDFGKEIIPNAISKMKVHTDVFNGFWEDIGTIKSFYEANLDLASINPLFNFYNEEHPIFTHKRHLPASKFNFCTISQSLTADGCIITNASIVNSIVGIRTIIESGANLDGVVCMGADWYESDEEKVKNRARGYPNIGIGRGCIVRHAIIDKNARIGDGCRIGIDTLPREDGEFDNYFIKEGIIIIPKNAALLPGTVI